MQKFFAHLVERHLPVVFALGVKSTVDGSILPHRVQAIGVIWSHHHHRLGMEDDERIEREKKRERTRERERERKREKKRERERERERGGERFVSKRKRERERERERERGGEICVYNLCIKNQRQG